MLVAERMPMVMCAMLQHECLEINSSAQNLSEMRADQVDVRTLRCRDSDIDSDIPSMSPPVPVL
jgi:hypothetical protein